MSSEKICFVVQRYGLEVNGGAELHCRQLAEHMLPIYPNIDVLTTKALDYMSWKNEYDNDLDVINGINVYRFPVEHERNQKIFDEINGLFYSGNLPQNRETEWMEKQGPYCTLLIEFLKKHQTEYKVIIFFTYLYYTTCMGIKVVDKTKMIVIPTAHDDPFYSMKIFDDVFYKPDAFFLNTEEEKELIYRHYQNQHIPVEIGGVGIDIPEQVSGEAFCNKYNLDNYIIYVGRIAYSKNCDMLFKYFIEYKKRNPSNLKLVLMGKNDMDVPISKDIVKLGFVSDKDKFDGIAGAKALILPSEFESLSIVVLEAMYMNTFVMVYGKCDVLRGHCEKSNGAFYYNNYLEFEAQLNFLNKDTQTIALMKNNAKNYVRNNYQWDVITKKLFSLIEKVAGGNK